MSAQFLLLFGLRQNLKYATLADLEFVFLLLQAMYSAGLGFHGGPQLLPLLVS